MNKFRLTLLPIILCVFLTLCGCLDTNEDSLSLETSSSDISYSSSIITSDTISVESKAETTSAVKVQNSSSATNKTSSQTKPSNKDSIPAFSGKPYVILNNNKPEFTKDMLVTKSYESFSPLDSLGRCSVAIACIGKDIMPTEDRESIGQVKPSGWQTVKYDVVDGKYLYNRCHLIGFQLTGENANTKNLITGTRYLNVEGMLPFENMVADYIKETGNHVIYRVTPIFKGQNLVASGVQIEAFSVEDNGDGICFNVYCYNAQPGIKIDYATGKSSLKDSQTSSNISSSSVASTSSVSSKTFVLNTNSKKIHYPNCSSAKKISEKNRGEFSGTNLQSLLDQGYTYCGICFK